MTGLNLARIAKLIALFGFFMPWVLVSCSGEQVGHLTGIDLATGGLTLQDPGAASAFQHERGHPNLWVTLSLAAVIGGLVLSFVLRGRQAALAVVGLAAVALAASAIGLTTVGADAEAQHSQLQPAPSLGQSGGLLRVDAQYGYFITLAGLLAAIAAGGMVLAGRTSDST